MKKLLTLFFIALACYGYGQISATDSCNTAINNIAHCIGEAGASVPITDTAFVFYHVKEGKTYAFYFNKSGSKLNLRKITNIKGKQCKVTKVDAKFNAEAMMLFEKVGNVVNLGSDAFNLWNDTSATKPPVDVMENLNPCDGYSQVRYVSGTRMGIWTVYDSDKAVNAYFKERTAIFDELIVFVKKL